jgi:hypothetical protein
MPDVGKIVAELELVLEGLGKAQNAAATASARALQVEARAAQLRFRRVAEGTSKVRERLKTIQTMQAGTATNVRATIEVVQQVKDDMNPGEVVSTLTPAADKIGAAGTSVATVIKEIDEAKAQVADVLRGGQPRPLVAMVEQIKQALVPVVPAAGRAKRQTEETIAEARQMGNF